MISSFILFLILFLAAQTVTEAMPENKPADGTSDDDDGRSQGK